MFNHSITLANICNKTKYNSIYIYMQKNLKKLKMNNKQQQQVSITNDL